MKKQSKEQVALGVFCVVAGALMGFANATTNLPETVVIVVGAAVVALAILAVHPRKSILVGGLLLYCFVGALVHVLMTR